jgi:hypothetical protein
MRGTNYIVSSAEVPTVKGHSASFQTHIGSLVNVDIGCYIEAF